MINLNKQGRKVAEDYQSPSTIHKVLFLSQSNLQFRNQPCKSPSPDKKRANIITPTKSPELIEIKRNMTPLRLSQRRIEKTPMQVSSKNPFNEQSTKYYTNEDFQEYRSSQHKKSGAIQELEGMLPQQFVLNNSNGSRLRMSQYRGGQESKKELDYIKLLQQKEKTIKELHEIIEMINRNNSLDLSVSQLSGSKNKRSLQNSDKFLSSLQSAQDKQQKQQLRQQIKTLTVENQQLVHMIEKIHQREFKSSANPLHESKYSTGDPHKYSHTEPQRYSNIDPHRYLSVDPNRQQKEQYSQRLKEENFMRELIALKQSLTIKQTQCLQLNYQNKQLLHKYTQVDLQNQKLIKMMKDKQLSDRKYHASLIESTLSAQKSPQSSQIITNHNTITKEKLSLIKIKEQYNESLKVFKDTVCGDVQEFMAQIGRSYNRLEHKVMELEEQIIILQRFKSAHENMKSKQKQSELIPLSIENKGESREELRESFSKINELQELSQIQLRSPQRGNNNREIESLIMKGERVWGVERQQQELREVKVKTLQQRCNQLERENSQLQQKCQLLHSKCLQLQQKTDSQQNNSEEQLQGVKVRVQMGQSDIKRSQMVEGRMARRNQQIEDINIGKAQELQINSLREMIRKYQLQSQSEKHQMERQIQMLKSKNMQYQREIHAREQESTISKIPINQQRHQLQQTRKQLLQANQQLQQTRQHLLKANQQLQQLANELQKAKSQIEQNRVRLEQKEQQIQEWRQLILSKEENQSHTHEQIQKLISNYSQQINILKQTLANERINNQHQFAKYQHQKQKHQQQKYNIQQQKLFNERIHEQETIKNQQNRLAHQQDIARFQQDIARYQQDIARYQQEKLKYEECIEQLNSEIRRLVSQGENVQRLMSDSESRNKLQLQKQNQQAKFMNQQIKLMQQQMKSKEQQMELMQDQLNSMNHQLELKNQQLQTHNKTKYKLREEEEELRKEHEEMKRTIERLLLVANQVQQMEVERNKLANELTQLKQILAQEKQRCDNLNQQNYSLTSQIDALKQQNNSLTQQVNALTQQIISKQEEAQQHEKRIQSMTKSIVQLESELNKKHGEIETLRTELENQVHKLRKQVTQQHALSDRLRKQLMDQQSQSIRVRRQSEQQISEEEKKRSLQQSLHRAQIKQYESQLSSLNTHIQQLTTQLQTLSSQSAQTKQKLGNLQLHYKELLDQQEHPLEELYDLRTLLTTKLPSLESQADKYDVAKLAIDYQFKCDQLLSLNTQLEQTKEQLIFTQSQKYLLQEKCLSLQKNISLYQTQLKQRKLLTQNLLNDKTKLEKQLVLLKKTQLQTYQHQSHSLKLNLANLINKVITIEEKRNINLKQKALQFEQRSYQYQQSEQRPYKSEQKPQRIWRQQKQQET